MAEVNDVYGSIYQNLIDAGCDTQTTDKCMLFLENGRSREMLPLLSQYREVLRKTIRCSQKQIDCLDFLIYKIKKSFE